MISGSITIHPVPYIPGQPFWIFLVLLGMIILAAWAQVSDFNRFVLVIKANFGTRYLHQLVRETNSFRDLITIAFSLIYLLSISLVIYEYIDVFLNLELAVRGFRLFLLITLLIAGFWALKLFLMNLLSVVFKTEITNHAYLLNIFLSISLIGIVLLPVLVFAVYLKSGALLISAGTIIFISAVIRLFKGFLIGLSLTRFSYFFLFVYLCTIELVPLLLLLKVILSESFNW